MKAPAESFQIQNLTTEQFVAICREQGLKCTSQREAVFDALQKAIGHPTVDEIWLTVRQQIQTVTRETVYRILNEFAVIGLIGRLDALAAARYDTCTAPHAHFICERCGVVIDYPLPKSLKLPVGMPADPSHVELRVTGLCETCRAQEMALNEKEHAKMCAWDRRSGSAVTAVRFSRAPKRRRSAPCVITRVHTSSWKPITSDEGVGARFLGDNQI